MEDEDTLDFVRKKMNVLKVIWNEKNKYYNFLIEASTCTGCFIISVTFFTLNNSFEWGNIHEQVRFIWALLVLNAILYNYRLLMRSTHDHEDRVRYWLTDAEGRGQPILDAVFMVMSRPKSKVYYCFIKLSGIFLHKDWNIHS